MFPSIVEPVRGDEQRKKVRSIPADSILRRSLATCAVERRRAARLSVR
jgi:hypothetical protein